MLVLLLGIEFEKDRVESARLYIISLIIWSILMKYIQKTFTIFALLSISFVVNAAGSLAIHDSGEILGPANPDFFASSLVFGSGEMINDIYLFDIDPATVPTSLATTATSIELEGSFSIADFEFALTDANGVVISDWGVGGESVDFSTVSGGTTYGVYYKGLANGAFGGIIAGSTVIAAVPVPAAAWLFASAMLGLVGIGRSRKA